MCCRFLHFNIFQTKLTSFSPKPLISSIPLFFWFVEFTTEVIRQETLESLFCSLLSSLIRNQVLLVPLYSMPWRSKPEQVINSSCPQTGLHWTPGLWALGTFGVTSRGPGNNVLIYAFAVSGHFRYFYNLRIF